MPQTITDLLNSAAEANKADRFRRGNLVCLPAEGSLVAAGDIHGHMRNFERVLAYADLANNPGRHLVLQEIIHGGPEDSQKGCLSYLVLFEALKLKLQFPDFVHIIMGNHDMAFINNSDVMKDGKEMNRAMRASLDREFGDESETVQQAISKYLFSQPLAVRGENRIWLSHSLPGNRYVDSFDAEIFGRQLEVEDISKPGSAYFLGWGRKFSQATLDKMAKLLDVDIFILGHQPQSHGWSQAGENLIIVSSEHNHGCLLMMDLAELPTIKELAGSIVPLASIS
jgi:hypothetical protein